MKYFIMSLLCSLFMSSTVFAEDSCSSSQKEEVAEEKLEINTSVPKHLQGATIIVRLKDGTESAVSAEKFKVVRRQQQFIVTKTKQESTITCSKIVEVTKEREKEKNRVSLLGGHGPENALNKTVSSDKVRVETDMGAVGGVQYQRLLNDKLSVGAQVQTNDSVLINVGIDF